jgi:hypothetical protein
MFGIIQYKENNYYQFRLFKMIDYRHTIFSMNSKTELRIHFIEGNQDVILERFIE